MTDGPRDGPGRRSRRARKRFGQHFLEPAWIEKVLSAIDPGPDDTFIEIGPGLGALTHGLAAMVKAVAAFEIDRDLAAALRQAAPENVKVFEGDFLQLTHLPSTTGGVPPSAILLPAIADTRPSGVDCLRVAGNLPYNAATPILFKLTEMYTSGVPLRDATVMLQREVADRLLADPGSREYGVLSILIRHTASVERLLNLPRGAFRPAPKVQSTVVRLQFHPPDPPVADSWVFVNLVRAVFTRRRKTMTNAFLAYGPSDRDQASRGRLPDWLDGTRRPETLSIGEFARLADDLSDKP